MFSQNRFKKKRVRTLQFRCERISVLSNNKVCHTIENFTRFASNLHDFLFLIHYNMEKELNRKLLWSAITAKNIEILEFSSWKTIYSNEENIGSIKSKTPR
ncbi:MAG: hypothetical protein LiPW41_153 [Parcubacteria group bacterium LiPW_41]|nr:MAG: hypothetical protein LiPW41_153 [Parcubacteria group bacterium LiPW_41]